MSEPQADLARRALAVNQANLALGHETFIADGATFVRDACFPRIYDANHVTSITAATADEIERLLARADAEFTHCKHRAFHTDFATPPGFDAWLQLDGYQLSHSLILLLESDLRGTPEPCDMRPVAGEPAWVAYRRLQLLDWKEYCDRVHLSHDAEMGTAMVETRRAKSPPVRYWLAFVGGAAVGYCSSWEGTDGVGQVEDLAVQPAYRHRGLATALVHHCVADARAHGAGPVVIVADASDTPKQMYAAMGFRPVAIKREYLKMVEWSHAWDAVPGMGGPVRDTRPGLRPSHDWSGAGPARSASRRYARPDITT
jgi:ribosomal protein S18 acetylase RimI-like enzyme